MKHTICLTLFMLSGLLLLAQDAETQPKRLTNVPAGIKLIKGLDLYVIVPNGSTTRYTTAQLPDALKIDSLQISFSGTPQPLAHNVRMAGTPIILSSICLAKPEMKKYKLKKGCYKF